jgi:hypothetical protein
MMSRIRLFMCCFYAVYMCRGASHETITSLALDTYHGRAPWQIP